MIIFTYSYNLFSERTVLKIQLKNKNLEVKMVVGATGQICLFAPLGASGPRFSSSKSYSDLKLWNLKMVISV